MKRPAAKKKAGAKAASASGNKKNEPIDFQEVRQNVRNLIGSEAAAIVHGVAEEAKKGHVTAMKALFDLVGLFPEGPEAGRDGEDDESLARVLLKRLGLPDGPIEDEDEDARIEREAEEAERAKAALAAGTIGAAPVDAGKLDSVE